MIRHDRGIGQGEPFALLFRFHPRLDLRRLELHADAAILLAQQIGGLFELIELRG
jgi:hypothetical protein